MNVREEDRQNKTCPSRGLGLAAAAIGVGVGAALYYFFSKRPENPDAEGSTSSWECERVQAFTEEEFEEDSQEDLSNDSYTTVSEHSTTDTSIHTTPCRWNLDDNETSQNISQDSNEYSLPITNDVIELQSSDDSMSVDTDEETASISSEVSSSSSSTTSNDSYVVEVLDDSSEIDNTRNDDDLNDWDVTQSSMDVMENPDERNILEMFQSLIRDMTIINRRRRVSEEEQLKFLRDQAFRDRSWSLEECSICFDVILKNQEVMSLPCTHNFHTACILPWLQEQQTCPNCRKAAE